MVAHPADYVWSSYHRNGMGKANDLLQPHEGYLSLGATKSARQLAYPELFRQVLDSELIDNVRATVQIGTPLGNNRFREQIEQTLQCGVGQPRRGQAGKSRNRGNSGDSIPIYEAQIFMKYVYCLRNRPSRIP